MCAIEFTACLCALISICAVGYFLVALGFESYSKALMYKAVTALFRRVYHGETP